MQADTTRHGGVRLGPMAVVAAAAVVPLAYVPGLDSVFSAPKLALLIVAGALGLGGHALALAGGAPRPRWPAALTVALAAALITTEASAIAAMVTRAAPGAPYAPAELLRWLAVLGVALAAAQAAGDGDWRRLLFRAIHASAGVVSLIGLVQHLHVLPAALSIPTISVPGSTFGNRNMAAEAVAMSIPFGLGLALLELRPRGPLERPRAAPLVILFLALETVYVAVTRTRGAWLGAALGAAAFFVLQRPALRLPARLALLLLGAGAALAAILPGRFTQHDSLDTKRYLSGPRVVLEAMDPTTPAARTRIGLWRRTLAMYREHPILGVGPGNFAVYFPRYAEPGAAEDGVLTPTVVPRRAHNDLIERLAETGAVGLLALLAVYAAAAGIAIRTTARARMAGGDDPALRSGAAGDGNGIAAAAAAGSLAALFASGLTGFPMAMPATALLFGVALGVLAAAGALPALPVTVTAPRAGTRFPIGAAWAFAVAATIGATVVSARELAASRWLGQADAGLRGRRNRNNTDNAGNAESGAAGRRALDLLARAERADPSSFRVALLTAHAAVSAGRGAEAVRGADRALSLEPDSPYAWAARADASLVAGDAAGAVLAARRATELLQAYPAALSTLARACARLHDGAGEDAARARLGALATHDGDARRALAALGPPGAPPSE